MLLWICPTCIDIPKTVKIECNESKCNINVVTPIENHQIQRVGPEKTMQEKSYGEICDEYMKNKCSYGISGKGCQYYHPKMCKPFTKFGPRGKRGCNKGDSCSFFHPKLCYKSLKPFSQRYCPNENCGYFHLPRTKRYMQPKNNYGYHDHINTSGSKLVYPTRATRRFNEMDRSFPKEQATGHDSFLGNLKSLIRESIQMEFATLQGQAPALSRAPPFLPGMSHFSQPTELGRNAEPPPLHPQMLSGPHLSQAQSQWGC